MHGDHNNYRGKILTLRALNVNTPSHKRGRTSNASKRLSFKKYGCMIHYLYLVSIFKLGFLFIDDPELIVKEI